jgi:hypothetical protein
MNFVLVNGRTPCRQSFCGLCCEPINKQGYVRDIRTQLCYCNTNCYRFHSSSAPLVLFEDRAKAS